MVWNSEIACLTKLRLLKECSIDYYIIRIKLGVLLNH